MASLATIPYGQYKKGELQDDDLARVGAFWKKYWGDSLKEKKTPSAARYPSFENWAAMMSYDRDAADGGEGFQNLMRLLLCGDSRMPSVQYNKLNYEEVQRRLGEDTLYISTNYAGELYWNCETSEYGSMFKTEKYTFGKIPPEDWFTDAMNSTKVYSIPDGTHPDRSIPSSTHVSHHSRPFIPAQNPRKGNKLDNTDKEGLYQGTLTTGNKRGDNPLAENFGTKFGYYPCSMMDFMTKANIKDFFGGSNNVSQSYKNVGIGPGRLYDCWEITKKEDDEKPCILARNKLAAYVGLYYYADCRDARLNWMVYETFEGRTYESQMRCPNPKYGAVAWYKDAKRSPFEHDKLFVREPLNPLNKRVLENTRPVAAKYDNEPRTFKLKEERNFDHVGGKHPFDTKPESKFEVPSIVALMGRHTHSPWDALINQQGFTLVQPFWYPAYKPPWYLMNTGNYLSFRHHEHLKKLKIKCVSNVLKHESGQFGFGFRVPAAFLTWPNYIYRDTQVTTARPSGSIEKPPLYMTEPGLADDIDSTMAMLEELDSLAKVQAKLESFYIDDRIQFARVVLNFAKYANLGEKAWRLALLEGQVVDDTQAPEAATQEPPQQKAAPKRKGRAKAPKQKPAPKKAPSVAAGPSAESQRPRRANVKGYAAGAYENAEDPGAEEDPREEEDDAFDNAEEDSAVEEDEVEDTLPVMPKKRKAPRRDGEGEGYEYDSDVSVEGGEEQETERVDLVGIVLTQYEEMKMINELSERQLEAHFPALDSNPDLANAISLLINRSKKYTEIPSNAKYHTLYRILMYANLLVTKLIPGRVEPKKDELNAHFQEERLQPFRYLSIYDEGRLDFRYEDTSQEAQEEFARKNGRDAQTYAVDGKTAQVVKGYETTIGRAREGVLDQRISDFRNDYMRILAIYFSNRGVGSKRLGFSVDEKRTGMLMGLWRFNEEPNRPQNVQVPVWIAKKGVKHGYQPNAQTGTQIWPPVFKGFDQKKLNGNELTNLVGKEAASAFAKYFLDQTDAYWEKDVFKDIELPESDMTVREWVTTPWHLHHLPYQVQYAVFRDGEAYCEGCKRCARPFYEYKRLLYSVDKPYLTTALWQQLDDDDGRKARVPIHDPQFKLKAPKKPLTAAEIGYKPKAPTNPNKRPIPIVKGSATGGVAYINDGQDPDPDAPFDPGPGTYNFDIVMLKKENVHKTDHKKSVFNKGYNSDGVPFRLYNSPVYSEERTHMYRGVPNGYMMATKTFGRPDHRVVRSHKFGNTCRDCQHILQNAPGLFEQNNRYEFGPQEPNAKKQSFATFPREDTYDALFKPAMNQRQGDETLEETLERIRASLVARNKLPPGWTKIVDVDIAINRDPRQIEKPNANTKQAEDDLAYLLATGKPPANPDWLKNPALRRSLEQLRSKFTHTRQTERVQSATGRFEAGIQRHEYRNCILRYEFNKEDQTFSLEWLNPSPELCEGFSGVSGWEAEGPDGRLRLRPPSLTTSYSRKF